MKRNLIFLLALITMISCRSLQKMVDSGRYDEAIQYSVQKLRGEKKKKTDHVMALETAFDRANRQDKSKISYFKSINQGYLWDSIHQTILRIERRQSLVFPLTPLVSKDGYRANFEFENYDQQKIEAADKASEYYYQQGIELIKRGEKGDKLAAQRALDEFEKIRKFHRVYKDTEQLKEKAYNLGITFVAVELQRANNAGLTTLMQRNLESLNITALNSQWNRFFILQNPEQYADEYVVIELSDLVFGPERELINNFETSAEVQEGLKYVLDANGKEVKDSTGNKITVPNMINVKAFLTEVQREKLSTLEGVVKIFRNGDVVPSVSTPIRVIHDYKDSALTFKGDQRALKKEHKDKIDKKLSPFPNDLQVMDNLSRDYLNTFMNFVRSNYRR